MTVQIRNACCFPVFPEAQNQPESQKNKKQRKVAEACCPVWVKRLHIHTSSVPAKKSLFVSGEFLLQYRAVRPPPLSDHAHPHHPDRARHCGKIWYKSSGLGGNAWSQIRLAHYHNTTRIKAGRLLHGHWKDITVCNRGCLGCVSDKTQTRLKADEFVSSLKNIPHQTVWIKLRNGSRNKIAVSLT